MLKLLKNITLTGAFVVIATMATAAVTAVLSLFFVTQQAQAADPSMIASTLSAAIMAGAMGGFIFSLISLPVAAITMPPTLGLARLLKLPRPLVDCIGGGLAALIVSAAVISLFESLARSKGGGAPGADMRFVFDVCAMLGGGALGYVRHYVLVRERAAPVRAQLVAA